MSDMVSDREREKILRANLLKWRGDISAKVDAARQSLRSSGSENLLNHGDMGDINEANSSQDVDVALFNQYVAWLKRVEDTLLSLDNSSYGVCYDCGEEIAEKRLKAIPFAMRCKNCQESYESREKINRKHSPLDLLLQRPPL